MRKMLVLLLLLVSLQPGYARGGGGGCFPAGTLIETPSGERKIENFKVGDKILAQGAIDYNELLEDEVVHVFVKEDELLTVYTEGPHVLVTTAEHPLLTANWYTPAGALRVGIDSVAVLGDGNKVEFHKVLAVTANHVRATVYTFETLTNHTFIANRFLVHNKGGGGGHGSSSAGHGSFSSHSSFSSGSAGRSASLSSRVSLGSSGRSSSFSRSGSFSEYASSGVSSSMIRPLGGSTTSLGFARTAYSPSYASRPGMLTTSYSSVVYESYATPFVYFPIYVSTIPGQQPVNMVNYDEDDNKYQAMDFDWPSGATMTVIAYKKLDSITRNIDGITVVVDGVATEIKAEVQTVSPFVANHKDATVYTTGAVTSALEWKSTHEFAFPDGATIHVNVEAPLDSLVVSTTGLTIGAGGQVYQVTAEKSTWLFFWASDKTVDVKASGVTTSTLDWSGAIVSGVMLLLLAALLFLLWASSSGWLQSSDSDWYSRW